MLSFFNLGYSHFFFCFLSLGFPKIRAGGREKKSEAKKKKVEEKKSEGGKKTCGMAECGIFPPKRAFCCSSEPIPACGGGYSEKWTKFQ